MGAALKQTARCSGGGASPRIRSGWPALSALRSPSPADAPHRTKEVRTRAASLTACVFRHVAFGATIVMAGLLAVMVAEQAWAVFFLSVPLPWFDGDLGTPSCMFDCDYTIGSSSYAESLIGVAVMIWLVGRMVRRRLRSITAGR